MQVEQKLPLRLLGASALGVDGLVGGDDLSAGHHGPGLDDGEWPDLRAVLDRRGLEQQAMMLDRVPEHQRLILQYHVVTDGLQIELASERRGEDAGVRAHTRAQPAPEE